MTDVSSAISEILGFEGWSRDQQKNRKSMITYRKWDDLEYQFFAYHESNADINPIFVLR